MDRLLGRKARRGSYSLTNNQTTCENGTERNRQASIQKQENKAERLNEQKEGRNRNTREKGDYRDDDDDEDEGSGAAEVRGEGDETGEEDEQVDEDEETTMAEEEE